MIKIVLFFKLVICNYDFIKKKEKTERNSKY